MTRRNKNNKSDKKSCTNLPEKNIDKKDVEKCTEKKTAECVCLEVLNLETEDNKSVDTDCSNTQSSSDNSTNDNSGSCCSESCVSSLSTNEGYSNIDPKHKNDPEFFSSYTDSDNEAIMSKFIDKEGDKWDILKSLVESHLTLVSIFKTLNEQ